jgi:hypothetical protein
LQKTQKAYKNKYIMSKKDKYKEKYEHTHAKSGSSLLASGV